MANVINTQIVQDGVRNVRVKVVGTLDTAGAIAATDLIDPATLGPIDNYDGRLATKLAIKQIRYSVAPGINITLYWDATADVQIVTLADAGDMSFDDDSFLQNNAGAGITGKIQYAVNIATTISATNVQTFSVILDLIKQ
jgi:hypothetical protein